MSDFRVVRQAMHDSPNADNYNTKGDVNHMCGNLCHVPLLLQ